MSITIIIAVYNRANTFQRCIDSIAAQTYSNIEIIVMDGGSKDGTLKLLQNNSNKIDYWESKSDKGIYHAFNKGLKKATGEWIYFLGSDDYLWNKNTISNFVKQVSEINNVPRIVYGKVVLVNHNSNSLETLNKPWGKIKKIFIDGCCICHQGVFHHRELFDIHGNFDESFRISGVYELLLRELKSNNALFLPSLTVAAMQTGGLSTSSQNSLEIFSEYERARQKNNVERKLSLRLAWEYIKKYIKGFLNKSLSRSYMNYISDFYRLLTFRKPIWFKIK